MDVPLPLLVFGFVVLLVYVVIFGSKKHRREYICKNCGGTLSPRIDNLPRQCSSCGYMTEAE